LIRFSRVNAWLSGSIAALVSEDVLVAVPVDVASADQALELFWRLVTVSCPTK
jgi:hypothetical protein